MADDIFAILSKVSDETSLKQETALTMELKTQLTLLETKLNDELTKKMANPELKGALGSFYKLANSSTSKLAPEPRIQQDLIKAMDDVLAGTSVGSKVQQCFKQKDPAKILEQANEGRKFGLIIDPMPPVIGHEVTFNPNLQEKKAAGRYISKQGPDGLIKSLELNSKSLNNPLNFILVYAHEMLHGCNIENKYRNEQVTNFYLGFENPCATSFIGPKKEACVKFESARDKSVELRNALQEGIIEELNAFKLMLDLFKELAVKDPSVCNKYYSGTPGGFFNDLNVMSEGEMWAYIEDQLKRGDYPNHVCDFYTKNAGYNESFLYQMTNDGKGRKKSKSGKDLLRFDFQKRLREAGF
ncbi:MAG: hypothetical protein JNL11_15390 [Bdellovibrionaceae bacterium]|nr:hypothetical protein [Pseudobdellovibrionaceae bacterium]